MEWLVASPVPLLLALALDVLFGEPLNCLHPVAWFGTFINALRRWAPTQGRWLPLVYGAALVCGGSALMLLLGTLLGCYLHALPQVLRWLLEACFLKAMFSLRGLASAAQQVRHALESQNLPEARYLVGWHLVSRDTSQLNAAQVAAAAIESVAENASDSIIAPLFYYALGGLPAALTYRFINTADAMLGYRDPVHAWLGKFPARLDDLVNLVPARLTAMFMLLTAPLVGGKHRRAWSTWRRDARRTASPNAGHPMSAMAGALGVELEKVGHYRLGAGLAPPVSEDILRAVALVYATTAVAVLLLGVLLF
ncbi:Cobalamin biosynthesis protein CobD [Candidatus Entotheonellaceae bacterium PAL068K]